MPPSFWRLSRQRTSRRKARSRKPCPAQKTPKILEVHITSLNWPIPGTFNISVVTDSEPAWTYYKWCWSGVYKDDGWVDYIDVLNAEDHEDYVSYWNHWNGKYWWQDFSSEYNCTIVSHGDNIHVADTGLQVWANLQFYLMLMYDGTVRPLSYVTDSDGTSDYVRTNLNGTCFPGW